ncbi:FtsK/SpoIIIE family DNA translocase [Terrihabitans rhizophilus]|uniref:DNA translocase FtsK n=1 Tax=Terrihabitans rhizophilus TaxID=3092662 RepID=A0ABU4RTY1_9HYPH|nr:DNA translocase FtsK 4TM domain-containing protein [Terrihabitans sp. PJ23]MDX6807549.1 DNA translocase FtsK 4TM domain-containing protein [Terrihabitans sp. PJ23]
MSDDMRDALGRRAVEFGGLVLVALAATAALALATWSAADPSLNNASDAPVSNMLGATGAFIADILMQTVGLGSIAFLLPIGAWGWRLVSHRPLEHEKLRLAAWLAAALAASGFASAFPAGEFWPLPSGFGGFVGETVLGLFEGLLGTGWLSAMALGVILLPVLVFAAGFGFNGARREQRAEDEDEDADLLGMDEEEERSFLPIGLVAHYWYTLKGALERRRRTLSVAEHREAPRAGLTDVLRRLEEEDDQRQPPHAGRALDVFELPEADDEDEQDVFFDPPPRKPVAAPPARIAKAAPAAARAASAPPARKRDLAAVPTAMTAMPGLYEMPPIELLAPPKKSPVGVVNKEALQHNARLLEGVLEDFGVKGEIIEVKPGPVVTLYELEPAPGIKSSRVIGLADDIARSMSAVSARVAVVPGRNVIGIELPNQRRETVYFREMIASEDFTESKMRLPLCLGKTIGGEPVIAELARMPHLLIAGTTGSGKSVAINTMILSLLYRLKPEECRLIMIDPKMLELSVYDGIPHLLAPVVTDPKKAVIALKWAVREMEQRYRKMSKVGVRNIDGFNARVDEAAQRGEVIQRTVQTGFDKQTGEAIYETEEMDLSRLPYIVVIVDEMADLMMVAGKEIEGAIQRLAQMARAAGIHIIMATQRPSVDVITGTIKANFPTRISFQVTSKIDSRTILGEQGAEQLLGQGDMLYMAGGGRIGRVHGPFCSDEEVEKVVAHLKMQGQPDYLDAVTEADDEEGGAGEDGAVFDKGGMGEPGGELFDQAVQIVLRDKKCSTSYIQRRLQIGYNRAASLVERMEREGIVGPANHAGKREILLEAERVENY